MKRYIKYTAIALFCLLAATLLFADGGKMVKNDSNVTLLPSLPKPIAQEYALITSAGQSTDTYIINDITNKMMIHNYFMPQAQMEDLDGIKSVVFVAGYSAIGIKLHEMTFEQERERVRSLLKEAKRLKLTVITVFVGGRQRRDKYTNELLAILSSGTDYLITTEDADYDGFLSDLARSKKIPFTITGGIEDIEEPFASAFR